MVEVEVREDDVANVSRIEPQATHLSYGGHLFSEVRPQQLEEEPTQAPFWLTDVPGAQARIEQNQPVVRFHQHTVAGEVTAANDRLGSIIHPLAANGTGRDAVEVMKTHAAVALQGLHRAAGGLSSA